MVRMKLAQLATIEPEAVQEYECEDKVTGEDALDHAILIHFSTEVTLTA